LNSIAIFGVYLSSELLTCGIALMLTYLLHRILIWLGLYRHVWHQALFETALFVVLWGLTLSASMRLN